MSRARARSRRAKSLRLPPNSHPKSQRAADDQGPEERYQHGDTIHRVPGENAGVFVQRVVTQNVLDRYLHRGQITLRQFDAGMRLYRLWRAAGSAASLTMTYAPRTDGSRELTEEQALLRSKLTSLLRRMGRFAEVLVHVCLCDQAARDWAVTRGDAPQAGVVVLRLALDQLADHWRL